MNFVNDFNILAILGGWNKHIFTPEWLGKYVFIGEPLDAQYPLIYEASLKVSNKKISINTLGDRLNFHALQVNDENLNFIEESAIKIVEFLPHTPINSFGINFEIDVNKDGLTDDIFQLRDNDAIFDSFQNKPISINIVRNFQFDDYILTFKIIKNEEIIKFNFNYHFTINNLVDFKSLINQYPIIDLKNKSIELLKNVYSVE